MPSPRSPIPAPRHRALPPRTDRAARRSPKRAPPALPCRKASSPGQRDGGRGSGRRGQEPPGSRRGNARNGRAGGRGRRQRRAPSHSGGAPSPLRAHSAPMRPPLRERSRRGSTAGPRRGLAGAGQARRPVGRCGRASLLAPRGRARREAAVPPSRRAPPTRDALRRVGRPGRPAPSPVPVRWRERASSARHAHPPSRPERATAGAPVARFRGALPPRRRCRRPRSASSHNDAIKRVILSRPPAIR